MKQFQPSESLAVGFLLALTGGLLDAYSYLNRGEVFATAETGNIVLMGSIWPSGTGAARCTICCPCWPSQPVSWPPSGSAAAVTPGRGVRSGSTGGCPCC